MKSLLAIIGIGIFIVGCQAPVDNSAQETFEKNSATVLEYLQAWEKESLDFDKYFAENAWVRPTSVGSVDSMSRAEMIANDKQNWESLDFAIPSDIVFLPGVNTNTKQMDGSVRYYGVWTMTVPATDSTKAVSVEIDMYESYDFDENGKIVLLQSYADWGGMKEAFEDAMEGKDADEGDNKIEEEEME